MAWAMDLMATCVNTMRCACGEEVVLCDMLQVKKMVIDEPGGGTAEVLCLMLVWQGLGTCHVSLLVPITLFLLTL